MKEDTRIRVGGVWMREEDIPFEPYEVKAMGHHKSLGSEEEPEQEDEDEEEEIVDWAAKEDMPGFEGTWGLLAKLTIRPQEDEDED